TGSAGCRRSPRPTLPAPGRAGGHQAHPGSPARSGISTKVVGFASMSDQAGPTLITDRLTLRRWRDADREPFARLNADPEVMRYFVRPISREDSDAFVDRIEASFDEIGYGPWAVERRDDGAFLGFTGLLVQT